MVIRILCIGKLKEKFYRDAVQEFTKRLSRYAKIEIVELADEKAPEQLSPAQKEQVKAAEGRRILEKLTDADHVTAMAIEGEQLDSIGLSKRLERRMNEGCSRFAFVIGGSLGLSEEVMNRANAALSFSAMTFSHQIFRVMLLEQIYRAFKILNNEPYHK